MPEICTCGAQLVPDSLFCHKCGKAQREILTPEILPVEPVAFIPLAQPVRPAPQPLGFRNPVAMKIALIVGVGAMLFNWLPFVNWFAGGFFAAYFYRRKTKHLMNIGAGVRMGWITGVIMFAIPCILFALLEFAGKLSFLREQLKNMPSNDPAFQQLSQLLSNPQGIVSMLPAVFVFVTCLSMAGGALGARMVGRN